MSDKYDNWERLVTSVLRRQRDREIALIDSCSVSPTSSVSDPNSSSNHLEYNFHESNDGMQMNFRDLSLNHRKWKEMLPPDSPAELIRRRRWTNSSSRHLEYDFSTPNHGLRMDFRHHLSLNHRQWKEMLAPNKPELIWRSAAPLMFFLDQRSGKNCFLLGTAICHWRTVEIEESRFSEAVVFTYPSILDIRAWIKAQILSPDTHYAAYLVFKSEGPVHSSRRTRNIIMQLVSTINVSEGPRRSEISKFSTDRGDGWMEIKVGEFYIHQHHEKQEDIELVLCGMDILEKEEEILVEGLEFRPSQDFTRFFKGR